MLRFVGFVSQVRNQSFKKLFSRGAAYSDFFAFPSKRKSCFSIIFPKHSIFRGSICSDFLRLNTKGFHAKNQKQPPILHSKGVNIRRIVMISSQKQSPIFDNFYPVY